MAAPSVTEILDNVGSSTVSARLQGLVDNFFDSNPLAARLLQQDRVIEDGGKDIRQRIIYTNKPGGSYGKGDTFDVASKESRTEMVFDWKMSYVNITIHGLDLIRNSGGKMVSDLVNDEMDEAELTAADKLGDQVFGDGTGNNSKDLTGLRAAFDDGSLIASYGGITRGSTAGTPGLAVSGNVTTTGITFSLSQMNTLFQTPVIGAQMPDLIITTQTLWNKWWERAQPAQRFGPRDANRPVGIGFKQIEFNDAAVVVDSHCPAGHIFFINTNHLKLVVHNMRMWSPTGWKYPTNQDSAIQQLLFAGEIVCRAPRLQNLATNVS